jgi:outer membrane protein assembly factor BamB
MWRANGFPKMNDANTASAPRLDRTDSQRNNAGSGPLGLEFPPVASPVRVAEDHVIRRPLVTMPRERRWSSPFAESYPLAAIHSVIATSRRVLLRLLLLGGFFCTQASVAKDWPEFRGPSGQGHSPAKNVPLHWNAASNVVWKTAIPGEGWSSPVLVDGKIFLTTAVTDSTSASLRALCVNANDGRIQWNVEVFQPDPGAMQAMHQKNSLASPTPVVHDDRIYVHFGHLGTAALDVSGKILWRQTELKYSPMHGNGGSPALVGDQLVFSCDGETDPFLVALDAKTGKVRWKTSRNSTAARLFSFSTPLAIEVDGATQVVSPTSGFVAGYDPKDGREIWRVRYPEGFSIITRPVFAHGLLFISSSYMKPVLYAIKAAGAKGDVTGTHLVWKHEKGAPNTPSPLVVGDELYFVSDSGIATCLDARTGKLHWSERLGGGFSASPILAEGRLFFQNEAGVGTVLSAGKIFEVLAKNDLTARTLASPAVTDNTLFLRSQSHLWRIGQ